MSDQIPLGLIHEEPPADIEDEFAKKELQAFESKEEKNGISEEYNSANEQHKIELLRINTRELNLKLDRNRIDHDREKAYVEGLRQDINARKDYADKIFKLVIFWLVGVFLILIFNMWASKLSDAVVMALIGGTTVNVLGLFLVVANYLFPKSGRLTGYSTQETDKP